MRNAVADLSWGDIVDDDCPVSSLNGHLLSILERFVPTKVLRLRNSDKPWFNEECRIAFNRKQELYRV